MFGGGQFDPSGLTALVLDDNHYERGISLDQLRAMGFGRVIGAANTVEAWQALRGNNPNIVLMEWIEDANDGLDFVRRVRMSEDLPNRAVSMFMLTTRGAASDVESARLAGIDGYLRKPISALALQQRVRTVIANPQPFVVTSAYVGPCPAPSASRSELPRPIAAAGRQRAGAVGAGRRRRAKPEGRNGARLRGEARSACQGIDVG